MQPATASTRTRPSLRAHIIALIVSLAPCVTPVWAGDAATYQATLASGKTKLEAGQLEAAWRDFQQAVQADGSQSEGYFYLAVASFRLGDHAAALEYGNAAVAAASAEEKARSLQLVEAIRKAKDTEDCARQADEAQDNGLNAKAAGLYARAFELSPDRGDLGLKAATLYAKRLDRLLEAAVLLQGVIASGDTASADAAGAELGALHSSLQQLYRDELPRATASGDLTVLVQLSQAFPIEVQPRLEVASLHAAKGAGNEVAAWLGQAVKLGAGFDSVRERAAFLDLWGKNDDAFKTFIRDAFGPDAVSEMERHTRIHQARLLEEHYKIKINTVKKHLLSGPFRLDMGAAAFRSLYKSRLSGFKTESPIIRHSQAAVPESFAHWIEFPSGFVVAATALGHERQFLDDQKLIDWDTLENPPEFYEKTDGKALRAWVDHVSAANLKPFLGLNENWKLVDATIARDDVYILSFATTVGNAASHTDVLKKLNDTFGAFQPFEGAPNGFLEYASTDAIRGGRFMFPQASGITFDGRIFKTRETLVDAPWILELRVSRMTRDTALFHKFYSVAAHKDGHATFSKRYAEQSVRETLQAAAGLKVVVAGRECVLEEHSGYFNLYDTDDGARATLSIRARDSKTGEALAVTFYDAPLASVDEIISRPAADPAHAWVHEIHLTQPARMTVGLIANGEEQSLADEETRMIPFYSADRSITHQEAIVASLPPPGKLTGAAEARRLARVFGYRGRFDDALFRFLREADEQGKFDDPFHLALLAPDSAKPALFARAAKTGNVRAMAELRMFYKEKWFDRNGTAQDRDQLFHWGAKAADAGDVESLKFMIDEARCADLLATERWMNALATKGEWRGAYDGQLRHEITQRAELVRKLASLPIEARARAFVPVYEISSLLEIEGSAIGKKFKDYATPEKQFSLVAKSTADRSGRKVNVYQRGQAIHGGPQQVWVNRKGIIIGEYYLIGNGSSAKSGYEDHLACFTQYFSSANLGGVPGTNLKAGVAVYNNSKTIELLLFHRQAYLKYIDHTLE